MQDKVEWYLIVAVGERLLALALAHVREVLRVPRLEGGGSAAVPGFLGMAQLRGELVPVLALNDLLEIPGGPPEAAGRRIVVLEFDGGRMALAVDAVPGLRSLAAGSLQAIALPGGVQAQQWGAFDTGFAQIVQAGGLLPAELWRELEAARQGHAGATV